MRSRRRTARCGAGRVALSTCAPCCLRRCLPAGCSNWCGATSRRRRQPCYGTPRPLSDCPAPRNRNEPLKRLLESRLAGLGIRRVEANPVTGSLLVFYEPERPLEAILGRIRAVVAQAGEGGAAARLFPAAGTAAAEPAWHARSAAHALAALAGTAEGLSPAEAARRLRRHGPNVVPDIAPRSRVEILLAQFGGLPAALLAAGALLALATGGLLDAGVIASALLLNGGIGFLAELRAERTIRSLAEGEAGPARVVRAGEEQMVAAESVVPGDIIALHPGDL